MLNKIIELVSVPFDFAQDKYRNTKDGNIISLHHHPPILYFVN
jgi:hypothetical protein